MCQLTYPGLYCANRKQELIGGLVMKLTTLSTFRIPATTPFLAAVFGISLAAFPISSVQAQIVLEEITVTAQKREENIQDVPISISVMTQETIDSVRSGGKDIRFLNGKVPSLIVESDFGRIFPRFYLRGVGNTDFDQNASQPVSLVYDEVVYENPMLKGFPIFDTQRVEVLRGPQGTLFGRNTPAGMVKIESNKPSDEFGGYLKLGAGNLDTTDVEAVINGPLGDKWTARLSVLHQTRGDFVANDASAIDPFLSALDDPSFLEGHEEFAARLQLSYEGETFSALINTHVRDFDGTATLFRANIIESGSNDFVAGFDPDVVNFDGRNEQTLEQFGIQAKLVWDLDDLTLTSISSVENIETFSRADVEGGIGCDSCGSPSGPGFIPFPAQTADGIPDHQQITQEIRLSNNASEGFRWQVGLYYFDEHLEVDSFDYADRSDAFVGFAHQDQDTTAWALFGQADWDLSDRTVLTIGLRYSDDEKDYVAFRPTELFGCCGTLPPVTVNVSDSEVSGNISLNYAISDDVSIYGKFARGFRAPSIQGRVLFGNAVTVADSELLHSLEFGVKSQLLDNRMRFNAAVYYLDIEDQQLTAGSGVANANQLVNAEKTTGYGLETDIEWAATENLNLSLGLSYNKTEIEDPNLSILPCGAPCTVLDPPGSFAGSVSIDGNSLPRAPEWLANFLLRYTFPLANSDVYFHTDWVYRDEYSFFLYDSLEFHGDSFLEVGAAIGWRNDRFDLRAYVRNLTDELELIAAIDFNNLEGIINEPQTYGVEFTFHF